MRIITTTMKEALFFPFKHVSIQCSKAKKKKSFPAENSKSSNVENYINQYHLVTACNHH